MTDKKKKIQKTKDARKIRSGLCSKWFREETNGDYYCRFYTNGKVKTKVRAKVGGYSSGKYKSLDDWHISKIINGLHFNNKEQFYDFVNCPFEKEEYQKMLKAKGIIKL